MSDNKTQQLEIPVSIQKKLLKLEKDREDSFKAFQKEANQLTTFMHQLWGVLIMIKTTRQFQQKWPHMFEDFCGITGLGSCDGKNLITTTETDVLESLISDFHQKLGR